MLNLQMFKPWKMMLQHLNPCRKKKKTKKHLMYHAPCCTFTGFHGHTLSRVTVWGKKKVEPSSTQLTAENNNNAMFITAAAAAAAAGYTGNNKKRLLKNQPDNNKAI